MTDNYLAKWQPAADDVLCILIAEHDAWIKAIDAGVTSDDMPPGKWQEAYHSLITLRSKPDAPKRPLLDTEIASICSAAVTVEWVAYLGALYDEYRAGAFVETLDQLKKFGAGHRQLQVLSAGVVQMRKALNNGLKVEEPVLTVIDGLQIDIRAQSAEPVGLGDLLDLHQTSMEADPKPGTPTGIHLLDSWIDGLSVTEFLGMVGPYKGRKTSVTSVAVLNGLKQGQIMNWFSFDEPRGVVINRMVAVLMAEWMYFNGHWEHDLNNVDVTMIQRAGKRWHNWREPLPTAYRYAYDTLRGYANNSQLRIYDSKTCDATMKSIRALSHTDAAKFGKLDRVVVDHLQSLNGYRTTYEQVENGSTDLHLLRGELGCQMWVIAQQNEEGIEHGSSWSPKVKGGGGLASKADTILISKYMVGTVTDPNYLRLELSQSRFNQGRLWGYVEIHPASGWITPRVVDVKKITVDPETWETKEVS